MSSALDVQATLIFLGRFQVGHDESYEGEEREIVLSSGATKGDVLLRERVLKLEASLATSKQHVLYHLIQSRQLQKLILQTEVLENAVKAHIEANAMTRYRGNSIASGSRCPSIDGSRQTFFDTETLQSIEQAAHLGPNIASSVQRALYNYDDLSLKDELDSAPIDPALLSDADPSTLDSLFEEIVIATSNGRISSRETTQMLTLGRCTFRKLKGRLNEDKEHDENMWTLLSSILRKKLRMIYVTDAIRTHREKEEVGRPPSPPPVNSSTQTMSRLMPIATLSTNKPLIKFGTNIRGMSHRGSTRIKNNPSPGNGGGGTLPSVSMTALSRASKGTFQNRDCSCLNKPHDPLPAYEVMTHLLQEAHQRQVLIESSIVTNLSLVSKSVSIGGSGVGSCENVREKTKHYPGAVLFSVRLSVQKIGTLLRNVAHKALSEVFSRWRFDVATGKLETAAARCIRGLATTRLFQGMERCLNSKLQRAMKGFKSRVVWAGGTERLGAVIETQRYMRGCLMRNRRWHVVRCVAATIIQCVLRCKIARRIVRYRRLQAHFRHCVARIEKVYLLFRWRLIGRNIRKFQQQQKMANNLQRFFRGYLARSHVARIRRHIFRAQGAVKLQSLWRRYRATLLFDRLNFARRRLRAVMKLQAVARGMIGRIRAARLTQIFCSARIIQCKVRCRMASKDRSKLERNKAAVAIQRVARMLLARKRVKMLRNRRIIYMLHRKRALAVIAPVLLGFHTRRAWLPNIRTHVARRKVSATQIQTTARRCLSRRYVARIRHIKTVEAARKAKELADFAYQRQRIDNAAVQIQRVVRGCWGRQMASTLKKSFQRAEEIRLHHLKVYYRLKEEYYRDQNTFHRPYVTRIQCFARVCRAKKRAMILLRRMAATKIAMAWSRFLVVRSARYKLAGLRDKHRRIRIAAIHIQRIVRGFMGRFEFRKHELVQVQKWFLQELRQLGLIGQALINFRIRKRTLERINQQVTRAQALVRCFLQRCKFVRGYKRMVREREARRKARRIRAATLIQGLARIIRAKKIISKRKQIVEEERRIQNALNELEGRIDSVHTDLVTNLMTTRAQSGVRGMQGKKAKLQRESEIESEKRKKEAARRANAATVIQALTRGVASRTRFKKALPTLNKERIARSFCVECEKNVVTRRCRQCKDRYCDACYGKLHRTGARRNHQWDSVAVTHAAAKSINKLAEQKEVVPDARTTGAKASTESKKDWEKFYGKAECKHIFYHLNSF